MAVTLPTRVPALPNVPTFEEAGLKGMVVRGFYGIIAPKRTPQAVIDRLVMEINKAMRTPDVMKRLVADGAEAATGTPTEFAAHIKSDFELWTKVVQATGLKVQ